MFCEPPSDAADSSTLQIAALSEALGICTFLRNQDEKFESHSLILSLCGWLQLTFSPNETNHTGNKAVFDSPLPAQEFTLSPGCTQHPKGLLG